MNSKLGDPSWGSLSAGYGHFSLDHSRRRSAFLLGRRWYSNNCFSQLLSWSTTFYVNLPVSGGIFRPAGKRLNCPRYAPSRGRVLGFGWFLSTTNGMQWSPSPLDTLWELWCCLASDVWPGSGYGFCSLEWGSWGWATISLHVATLSFFNLRWWQLIWTVLSTRRTLLFWLFFSIGVGSNSTWLITEAFGLRAQVSIKNIFFAYFCFMELRWCPLFSRLRPRTVLWSRWLPSVAWTRNTLCVACTSLPSMLLLFQLGVRK